MSEDEETFTRVFWEESIDIDEKEFSLHRISNSVSDEFRNEKITHKVKELLDKDIEQLSDLEFTSRMQLELSLEYVNVWLKPDGKVIENTNREVMLMLLSSLVYQSIDLKYGESRAVREDIRMKKCTAQQREQGKMLPVLDIRERIDSIWKGDLETQIDVYKTVQGLISYYPKIRVLFNILQDIAYIIDELQYPVNEVMLPVERAFCDYLKKLEPTIKAREANKKMRSEIGEEDKDSERVAEWEPNADSQLKQEQEIIAEFFRTSAKGHSLFSSSKESGNVRECSSEAIILEEETDCDENISIVDPMRWTATRLV